MKDISQGDIVKVSGFPRRHFVVVSKNVFIRSAGVLHICPFISGIPAGPLHIPVKGKKGTTGTVICEQIKLIDPMTRGITRMDRLGYTDIMNVSDAIQGIFEYD